MPELIRAVPPLLRNAWSDVLGTVRSQFAGSNQSSTSGLIQRWSAARAGATQTARMAMESITENDFISVLPFWWTASPVPIRVPTFPMSAVVSPTQTRHEKAEKVSGFLMERLCSAITCFTELRYSLRVEAVGKAWCATSKGSATLCQKGHVAFHPASCVAWSWSRGHEEGLDFWSPGSLVRAELIFRMGPCTMEHSQG